MNEGDRFFVDYLSRQTITDSKSFTLDIDNLRSMNSSLAQDVIKDPSKYYKTIKKHLEKLHLNDEAFKRR